MSQVIARRATSKNVLVLTKFGTGVEIECGRSNAAERASFLAEVAAGQHHHKNYRCTAEDAKAKAKSLQNGK